MRRLINVGPGMTDYQPIHLEFLWVRWYRRVSTYDSWIAHKLEKGYPPRCGNTLTRWIELETA